MNKAITVYETIIILAILSLTSLPLGMLFFEMEKQDEDFPLFLKKEAFDALGRISSAVSNSTAVFAFGKWGTDYSSDYLILTNPDSSTTLYTAKGNRLLEYHLEPGQVSSPSGERVLLKAKDFKIKTTFHIKARKYVVISLSLDGTDRKGRAKALTLVRSCFARNS